ncbi:heat shock transcription factor 1a [Oncorhynchus mykiss]|uniref:Heat shock transcription factor 1 isoform a n=1 Tax=Oncorhynchus mykiss TaxID=8022 RepID=Q76M54_ONCMY|nr:heat shock transcription factor 1a [Oncorhynchus mykiss]BAD10988.1 heat shock transcription factor 1 isoform a [Oncorhynchus mykiss]
MEFHGGGSGGVVVSGSNVPAFLMKLWTLIEDPDTDPLICWSPNGNSFHVFDQGQFSKDVLPRYFKHSNMTSFVRQLNMYGFRKVVHIEQGGLVKPEKDDMEFQHPYFIRGQEPLLENIKRKVTNVSNAKHEDLKMSSDDVSKILTNVQNIKGKQETIDSQIIAMKHENETLWREVASLRQKHVQQQKVVNKLIQFLVTLVQSNRVLGMKRKIPLMLNDSSSAHSMPKYSRQYSLEHLQASSSISPSGSSFTSTGLFTAESSLNNGPIISDVTDLAQASHVEVTNEWMEESTSPLVHIKEEPSSHVLEEVCPAEVVIGGAGVQVDTPLSPINFINSILQESNEPNAASTPTTPTEQKCLSLACLDKSELSDHLDSIDNGLENLQTILNAQSINFESSPFFEFFSSSLPGSEFDLESLDSIQDLLSSDPPKGAERSDNYTAGKQLVQYTNQPMLLTDPLTNENGGADLPTLLEGDFYFSQDPEEEPTISLTSDIAAPDKPKLS